MPPLVEELIPCPDPWDVARKLAHLPHLLFLDSSERHAERGRYSYVMADPVSFQASGRCKPSDSIPNATESGGLRPPLASDLPPFRGALAGLVGYDFNRTLERLPDTRYDEFQYPHTAS